MKTEGGKNCLLDVYNVDWAPIFVDMFSRRLDKLKVTNENYEGYLTASSVDTLMEVNIRIQSMLFIFIFAGISSARESRLV